MVSHTIFILFIFLLHSHSQFQAKCFWTNNLKPNGFFFWNSFNGFYNSRSVLFDFIGKKLHNFPFNRSIFNEQHFFFCRLNVLFLLAYITIPLAYFIFFKIQFSFFISLSIFSFWIFFIELSLNSFFFSDI